MKTSIVTVTYGNIKERLNFKNKLFLEENFDNVKKFVNEIATLYEDETAHKKPKEEINFLATTGYENDEGWFIHINVCGLRINIDKTLDFYNLCL